MEPNVRTDTQHKRSSLRGGEHLDAPAWDHIVDHATKRILQLKNSTAVRFCSL